MSLNQALQNVSTLVEKNTKQHLKTKMSTEESKVSPAVTKKRKLNSFTAKDVPSETLSSKNVDDILENLDNINDISDIETIQKKLQVDYKLLARQFGNSRISRVDALIAKIEDIQNQVKKMNVAHETLVKNNLPQVEKQTGSESNSLNYSKTLKRKRYSHGDLHGASSPPPEIPFSPPLEQLPIFTESFEKVLEPYKTNLKALRNNYNYEAKLIEDSARRNVELTWRQNIKDRGELRKKLRLKLEQELIDLDKDYNNVTKYTKVSHLEKRFRTSTRKVGERKGGRYASMEAQRDVESRVRKFHNVFRPDAKPVGSADENDIEYDLQLMKQSSDTIKLEKIEANYLYLEQPLKKETIGPTTMTDLVNSEIEERGIAGMQFQVPADQIQYQQQPQPFYPNYQQQMFQPPFQSPYAPPQQPPQLLSQQSPYAPYRPQLQPPGYYAQQQQPLQFFNAQTPYQPQPQPQVGQFAVYPPFRPQN